MNSRVACAVVTFALLACGRSPLAGASHPAAVSRALSAHPHRLAVVFVPQLSGCASCDQMISAVIREWSASPNAQIAVISVVPDRAPQGASWLPGTVVRLSDGDYGRLRRGAPLPRVEIWSADGSVLMSRSIPNYGSQAQLLTDEMLAARSYTAPVATMAGKATSR